MTKEIKDTQSYAHERRGSLVKIDCIRSLNAISLISLNTEISRFTHNHASFREVHSGALAHSTVAPIARRHNFYCSLKNQSHTILHMMPQSTIIISYVGQNTQVNT